MLDIRAGFIRKVFVNSADIVLQGKILYGSRRAWK